MHGLKWQAIWDAKKKKEAATKQQSKRRSQSSLGLSTEQHTTVGAHRPDRLLALESDPFTYQLRVRIPNSLNLPPGE